MSPLVLPNPTMTLVAPENWDSVNGVCIGLDIIRENDIMYSFWKPTWKERFKILIGRSIQLSIVGQSHPPVSLEVCD